jgi:hypothetical protein
VDATKTFVSWTTFLRSVSVHAALRVGEIAALTIAHVTTQDGEGRAEFVAPKAFDAQ